MSQALRLADLLAETGRVAARLAHRTTPGPMRDHLRDIHTECLDIAIDVALHTDATWTRGPEHWRRLSTLPGMWAPATVHAALDDVLANAVADLGTGQISVPPGLGLSGRLVAVRRLVAILDHPVAAAALPRVRAEL